MLPKRKLLKTIDFFIYFLLLLAHWPASGHPVHLLPLLFLQNCKQKNIITTFLTIEIN